MSRAELAVWLQSLREWAQDPQAWVWVMKGVVIFPDDVTDRPDDDELIEFLRARCAK